MIRQKMLWQAFARFFYIFFYKGGLLRKKSKNVRNIHIQWNVAHDRNVAMVIIIFFSERLGGNANLRST